jgi:hypothetical protein
MPPTDKPVSRREFARRTAAFLACSDLSRRAPFGAASATLLPLRDFVPTPAAAVSQPAQAPANGAKLSAQSQAEGESRYQAILQQYPDRFSDAQKTDLKRICLDFQPTLDHLRAYTISNSDLPALYLKPLVDRDKKPVSKPAAAAPGNAKSALPATKPATPAPGKP